MKKIISLALTAATLFSMASCGKKEENKPEENNGQNVTVYEACVNPIVSTVTYTGEIKASESVSISSKVSAKALSIYCKEGDYVNAGQVLAKLDDTDYQLAYKQAEAAANSAAANYNMVVNSSTKQATVSAEQGLKSAQLAYDSALSTYNREKQLYESNSAVKLAEQGYNDAVNAYNRQKELYDNNTAVIAAENAYTTAQQNLDRVQQLFDMGAASQVELDTAKNNVSSAKAAYDNAHAGAQAQLDAAYSGMVSAEENFKTTKISASRAFEAAENALKNAENALKNAKEGIELTGVSTKETISTAAASVESARANLATAKNTLNNTTITAPIAGYISTKNINEGQLVSPGVEIFSIKNSNTVDAEINVTESVIPYVQIGTDARIKINSVSDEELYGVVTLVNTVKNAQTGMYTVRVSIPNDDDKIKVGMFADVTLTTEQSEESIVIPSQSLMQSGDEMYVYVVNGTKAEKRTVLTGIQNDEYVEVLSGINEGDEVVVSGKEYLSETNNTVNITSKEGNN